MARRHGLDGDGAPLLGTVNDDPDATPNARWNDDEQTYYGEDQGYAVESVVYHEFAHGVECYMVDLDHSSPENEALSEGLSWGGHHWDWDRMQATRPNRRGRPP